MESPARRCAGWHEIGRIPRHRWYGHTGFWPYAPNKRMESRQWRCAMKNLDSLAAETAQAIITDTKSRDAGEVDNLITTALGVLQENGVYAGLLYLYSRTNTADKPISETTRTKLLDMTPELGLPKAERTDAISALKFLTDNICNNLDRLLLVKQLWEQTLIYARYGAKAR